METTIRLKPSELNESLFAMVKKLVKANGIQDISINLNDAKPKTVLRKETRAQVRSRIEKAANEIRNGTNPTISFTAEEFEKLSESLQNK